MIDICTPIYPMYFVGAIAGLLSVLTFWLGYFVGKAKNIPSWKDNARKSI